MVSFVVAYSLLRLLSSGRALGGVVDRPNERSLHEKPISRTGGLAIMAGAAAGWVCAFQSSQHWQLFLWPCVLLLIAISFLDDMHSLPAGWRLLAHVLVSMLFLTQGAQQPWDGVYFMLLVALVWMINLYNFMDGSDGLAGGMALIGFGICSIAAWLGRAPELTLVCVVISVGAFAFLCYNFHPAKIFMGDSGSIPLGFLSGVIGIVGWQKMVWPIWFPTLAFSPFIMDATITLVKRLLRGEKFWQAHREHYYQHLVQTGWGHKKTALWEYALMLLAGLSALWLRIQSWDMQVIGLVLWVILYIILIVWMERRFRQEC